MGYNARDMPTPQAMTVSQFIDSLNASFAEALFPYGVSIELYNVSRHEQVWKGKRKSGSDGPMEVYSNPAGYAVRSGETYKIVAVYDNPGAEKIDAMAGLFMLYSRN